MKSDGRCNSCIPSRPRESCVGYLYNPAFQFLQGWDCTVLSSVFLFLFFKQTLTLSASWEEESLKMELEDKLEMGTPVFSQRGARAALLSANFEFSMQRVLE